MSNPDDPNAWLEKVDADLLAIENNLVAPRIPWSVVAFHAQQAAEKVLKAFLVSTGDTVPRTHDLGWACATLYQSRREVSDIGIRLRPAHSFRSGESVPGRRSGAN